MARFQLDFYAVFLIFFCVIFCSFSCKYFYVSIQYFLLIFMEQLTAAQFPNLSNLEELFFLHFFNFSTIVLQNNSAASERCLFTSNKQQISRIMFIKRVFLLRLKKGLLILKLYCLVVTENQIDLNKAALKTYRLV